MTHWLEFSQADWQRIELDWTSWWQGMLDRPLVAIETIPSNSGITLADLYTQLGKYGLDTPVDSILDQIEIHLKKVEYLGDAFPRWWPNFGPGSLAAILGSELEFVNNTTWFHPLPVEDLFSIQPGFNRISPWWKRHQEFMERAIARWQNTLVIGNTDIGGNLDVLASLRGSNRLLTDLVDHPDQIEVLTRQITSSWLEMYTALDGLLCRTQKGRSYWTPFWAPGRMALLQCDFSSMISPKMFNQFVLPDIQACCEVIEYPFYHLDGRAATRHLDALLSIEKLRGIQWVPGAGEPPAEEWLPLLSKIREAGKLCQIFISAQGALKICRELGGQGFAFNIGDGVLLTVEEGLACTNNFQNEGFI